MAVTADNPFGLSQEELSQIDVATKRAETPNVNYLAGMVSGSPQAANLGSQLQAQQTRVRGGQLNSLTNALNARSARRETSASASALAGAKSASKLKAETIKHKRTLAAAELAQQQKVDAAALSEKGRMDRAELRRVGKLSDQEKINARERTRDAAMEQQHKRTYAPNPLPTAIQDNLSAGAAELMSYERGISTFKDEFVSGLSALGKMENWIAGNMGPLATPEMREQAEWWRDYGYELVLEKRHEMFGAAFTDPERRAWEAVSITQGMPAEDLKTALKKRMEIAKGAVERDARMAAQSSFNPGAVQEAFGEDYEWADKRPLYEMPPYISPFVKTTAPDEGLSEDEQAELAELEKLYGNK